MECNVKKYSVEKTNVTHYIVILYTQAKKKTVYLVQRKDKIKLIDYIGWIKIKKTKQKISLEIAKQKRTRI